MISQQKTNAGLQKVLSEIEETTGIHVNVYADMESSYAFRDVPFSDITVDTEQKKTFFRFVYRNAAYVGEILGCERVERNYASMLSCLIESSGNREANLSKDEYLRLILLGDSAAAKIQKFIMKFSVPESACFVLVVRTTKHREELLALLKQCGTGADMAVQIDDLDCAVVHFVENDLEQNTAEYGAFLAQSAFEELGMHVRIGVGSLVKNLFEVNFSYQQAATAVRMSDLFGSKGEVHTYKEYLLVKMLEDIPEQRLDEYRKEWISEASKEVFEDEDMMNTAEEFLQNSLNVSETSRNLYMHRNTLMYRLDKIERITGLNIRSFPDAVSFRVITILYKLIK